MSDPEPASPTFADRRAGSLATEMELDRAEEELRQARRRRVLTRPAEVVVAHDSDSDVSVEEDPLTTIPQRVATRPPARPRPVRAQRSSSSYGVDATPPKTFTTRNLPPAIAEIATHPGWLHTQVQSGKLIGYTGLQIIQDSNLFPGSRPTKQDEPFGPLTAGTPPGSSVRCGRLPVETSSSQPSLLLPNARFSSASSMGCSGVLAGPTDRIFSLSIDFLLVTETETSVEHSYVREPRWMYPSRVSKAAVVMTDDPMERRGLGCGCETRRIDCQGCGMPVGYFLNNERARPCYRHHDQMDAFDPTRVHLVTPSPSARRTSQKRKRTETRPPTPAGPYTIGRSSDEEEDASPSPALITGSVRGAASGPISASGLSLDGSEMGDEMAVETSLTEARRVVGR